MYSYSPKKMFQKQKLKKSDGGKANNSLDQIRLYKFNQKIASNNKVVQPEYFCPTSDATGFHSFRVYYQVKSWKERDNLTQKIGAGKKKIENFSRSTQVKTQHQQLCSS